MILDHNFLTGLLAPVLVIVAGTLGLCGRKRTAWGFVLAYGIIRFLF